MELSTGKMLYTFFLMLIVYEIEEVEIRQKFYFYFSSVIH